MCNWNKGYQMFNLALQPQTELKNRIRPDAKLVWDGDDDYFNVDEKNDIEGKFKDGKPIKFTSLDVHGTLSLPDKEISKW